MVGVARVHRNDMTPTVAAFGEEVVMFGSNSRLVGVLSRPSPLVPTRHTGVVMLNAGVVHRVGPQRLWVSLSRRLASNGFTVFRFDHGGVGDSAAGDNPLGFDQSSLLDLADALRWLTNETACRRFALVGLCSGTLTAFRAAQRDDRVSALLLLTALLEDPTTVPADVVAEASGRRVTRSYVTEKVASGRAWARLLTGRVSPGKILRSLVLGARRAWAPAQVLPGTATVLAGLRQLLERGVPVLFLFGEPSTVLEYFRMTLAPHLKALRRQGSITDVVIPGADHTFTERRHQERVMALTSEWLDRRCI